MSEEILETQEAPVADGTEEQAVAEESVPEVAE